MTNAENVPMTYPEFTEAGDRNPVRLPLTEASEQWEVNSAQVTESMEAKEPWSLGKPATEPDAS